MKKLLAIAWREIYTRFTDRTLLLIMLLAPLGISTIVGLAFGGLSSGSSPVEHIPVIVLNEDAGTEDIGNLGSTLAGFLVEGDLGAEEQAALSECPGERPAQQGDQMSLDTLIDGQIFDQDLASSLLEAGEIEAPEAALGSSEYLLAAAKSAVDRGLYTALVHIPKNYSETLASLSTGQERADEVQLRVYANRGRALSAGIVRSVVDSIASQMVSGNIAIGVTIQELIDRHPQALAAADQSELGSIFGCLFMPSGDLISLESRPVQAAAEDNQAGGILVAVGSAQGMFFALFTAQFGILSIYEERKNWTLQRMISTPTPRWAILGGKLVGVIGSVLFQLTALLLALTLVGSLMVGHLLLIWGDNLLMVAVLLLAIATAVGGLGMLMAGITKSIEQANIFATVLNMALGVLGGTFGFQLPAVIAGVSMIHWGREGFELLAAGNTSIGLHLAILFGQGALLFVIGLIIFSRRFEVS